MSGRLRVIVLLPVVVFLWLVGWSLIWIDSKKSPRKSVGANAAEKGNSEVSLEVVQEPDALVESTHKR
jgi:hypothetical protein